MGIIMYTLTKRAWICYMKTNGTPVDKITVLFGATPSTAYKVVSDYKKTGSFYPRKSKAGAPRKMTLREDWIAAWAITSGRCKTAVVVKQQIFLHLEEQTICHSLKRQGLNAHKHWKVPFLKKCHIQRRFAWAKSHQLWKAQQWRHVIFSDESKFNIFGSDGVQYCWGRTGEALDLRNTIKSVKHGRGSVMLWGCITWHGFGRLHRVHGQMNAIQYTEILSESLLGTLTDHRLNRRNVIFAFAQDNDPKHTSKLAQKWFADKHIKLLPWPAQSPDMNIIEHVWDALDRLICKHKVPLRNEEELWIGINTVTIQYSLWPSRIWIWSCTVWGCARPLYGTVTVWLRCRIRVYFPVHPLFERFSECTHDRLKKKGK